MISLNDYIIIIIIFNTLLTLTLFNWQFIILTKRHFVILLIPPLSILSIIGFLFWLTYLTLVGSIVDNWKKAPW